jgi:hypothetical protein
MLLRAFVTYSEPTISLFEISALIQSRQEPSRSCVFRALQSRRELPFSNLPRLAKAGKNLRVLVSSALFRAGENSLSRIFRAYLKPARTFAFLYLPRSSEPARTLFLESSALIWSRQEPSRSCVFRALQSRRELSSSYLPRFIKAGKNLNILVFSALFIADENFLSRIFRAYLKPARISTFLCFPRSSEPARTSFLESSALIWSRQESQHSCISRALLSRRELSSSYLPRSIKAGKNLNILVSTALDHFLIANVHIPFVNKRVTA